MIRQLRLFLANALCRLAALIAGSGVEIRVRMVERFPPRGFQLSTPIHQTPGSARVIYG